LGGGGGPGHHSRPPNLIASALAGFEVRGDALLTSLEFRDSDGDGTLRGTLMIRNPSDFDFRAIVGHLHRKSGDVVDYVREKLGRPFLGARAVPRLEAWQSPPKMLLTQYVTQFSERAKLESGLTMTPVGHDGESLPAKDENPRGFRASFDLVWPAGAPPPVGARPSEHGAGTIRVVSGIYPRKAGSKQKDRVPSAESQGAIMLLGALHERNVVRDTLGSGDPPTTPPATLPFTAFQVVDILPEGTVEAPHGGTAPLGEALCHPPGSRLTLSYTLKLLPTASASALPQEPGGAEDELVTLESRQDDVILLGGCSLLPEVEDILTEMAVGSERLLMLRGRLLMHSVRCQLRLTLHSVEPPDEDLPNQALFNAPPGSSGKPHGQERLAFVADLVKSWAPSSLMDVGCGEAKLLSHLLSQRVHVPRVVGIDVNEKSLRRAGRLLERTLASAAAEGINGAQLPSPHHLEVRLCDIRELRVACDAITLVEVVEHLDPPILEQIGPVLLGRCAPRRLLVTTPNKEYNLNFIAIPKDMQPDAAGRYTNVPPVGTYPLRNLDHRFEWTRAEFRAWANALASRFHYSVTFCGLGGGSMDEVVPYGEWRGPGPQTQAAVFERLEANPAAATEEKGEGAAGAQPAAAPPPPSLEHVGTVVWQSATDA
jgi:SAM-dependent methyltransferase